MKKLLLSLLAVAGAWTSAFALDDVPAWKNDWTNAPTTGQKFYLYNTSAKNFVAKELKDEKNNPTPFVDEANAALWVKNSDCVQSADGLYLNLSGDAVFTSSDKKTGNILEVYDYTRNFVFTYSSNAFSIHYRHNVTLSTQNGWYYIYNNKGVDVVKEKNQSNNYYQWYLIKEIQYANHIAYAAYHAAVTEANTKVATDVSKAWRDKYLNLDYKLQDLSTVNHSDEINELTEKIQAWNDAPQNYALMTDELTSIPEITNKLTQIDIVRTIPADKWNTICLPFDYTPEGWLIYEVTEEVQSGENISVTVAASEDGKIMAGKPYVIKPSSDVNCIIANDVTLTDAGTDGEVLPFVGTYTPITIKSGDYYVSTATGDLKFKYLGEGAKNSTLKGFRAYFPKEQGSSNSLFFTVDEGSLTQVLDAISEQQNCNSEMYDINGRRVNALKSGIYVVGGKKVIIK